jgi:predicted DCC family thiol-disulfide oxidoreductase YuxK
MQESRPSTAAPVLLFDGECGLCNRLVRGLLRLDREGRLRFAALQGVAAQSYLKSHHLPQEDFDSLVFVPDWHQRERPDYKLRTAGALSALAATGKFGRRVAAVISVVPKPIADAVYRIVGHWRYRLFGPWRPSPLARREWEARFLDQGQIGKYPSA